MPYRRQYVRRLSSRNARRQARRRSQAGRLRSRRFSIISRRRGYSRSGRRHGLRIIRPKAAPRVHYQKLQYNDCAFNLGPSASTYGRHVFSLNSTYDPDETGVGVQPYARDFWVAMYGRYEVYYVTWSVMLYAYAADQTDNPLIVQTFLRDAASDPTYYNVDDLTQEYKCKTISWDVTNRKCLKITGKAHIRKAWRAMHTGSADPSDFQSIVNSDPVNEMFLFIWVSNPSESVRTCTVYVNVKINYYTKFTDRAEFNES